MDSHRHSRLLRTALVRTFGLALVTLGAMTPANACLSDAYKHLRTHCIENTQFDRLLSLIFADTKPRQIAVIAGVSRYPNLSNNLQLPPAESDIEMLRAVLVNKLGFDEVITLKNDDFSFANVQYIFENYLPDVLQMNPRSRVVFAFSGHGSEFDDHGFLYFAKTRIISANNYGELTDALNLTTLKVMMAPTMRNAQHFLALINSCMGGYFLDVGVQFGANSLEEKGAHGITAGGTKDSVHAYSNVGTGKGSVFFEMVVAALSGRDVSVGGRKFEDPSKFDGILTTTKLANFLADTISIIENYSLSPRMGSLTGRSAGNQGEFFFVTDYERAKVALSSRYPIEARRVFGDPGTTQRSNQRPAGLYALGNLAPGTLLNADMFSTSIDPDSQALKTAEFPLRFAEDVRGACLSKALQQGERLRWDHLSEACK